MKFKLVYIVLIYCTSAFAQKEVKINQNITVVLPTDATRYNDTSLTNTIAKNLGTKDLPSISLDKFVYKVDDIVFRFIEIKNIQSVNFLDKEQKQIQSLEGIENNLKRQTVTKKINSNHFLLETYEGKKHGYFNFYCLNPKKNKGFRAFIKYNLSNKNESSKIIQKMLESIRFND